MRLTGLIAAAGLIAPAFAGGDKGKKLVTPRELINQVKLKDLLAGSQKLQDFADANGGNRAFGGGGHNATVNWLYSELKKTGYYNVVKQPFVELFTAATIDFSAGGTEYDAFYMTYGPSGNVTAPLVQVANIGCDAADYPAEVSGNIALVSRGTCPFAQKATLAKAAGAIGTVIYNNVPGALAGTLGGTGDYAATVGIAQETGQTLLDALATGEVSATLIVDAIAENRTTYNVIAETKTGDKNNVLVLGGHTDSVFAGPGINDDGSGTVGVLTVAKALTKYKIKNAVRFAFWAAEEFGLLGSYHYMKTLNGTISGSAAEVAKIRAYLNFDMIASPNYVLGIYDGDGSAFNLTGPTGSDTIEKDFEDFFKNRGVPSVPSIFSGRSDYAAFLQNGVPSGGLFTGAEELKTEDEAALFGGEAGVALDANYHQAGDTIDNLSTEAYLINAQSIANSVAKYAVKFEGIPKANVTLRKRDAEVSRYMARFADTLAEAHKGHVHAAPCGQGALLQ
ncbi:Leucyl aminopeptidase yscIV [Didymosphaeria variabile]|uniref:Peptide hydrolase n=1 Tax=Didymosphaeria variabile TaxID=1932322 RepID=A0A9W8XK29_9PLEO|nr:Leucyl aminopeptidase yscIV [Didymosphaeria variabile]KAJ4352337.1 Leucyl aminopeptidase yscIV [Didymosphaeria variabile]